LLPLRAVLRYAVSTLAVVLVLGAQAPASAAPSAAPRAEQRLDAVERDRLLAGELVTRPLEFQRHGGKYIGGVSYQLLRASPDEVLATLQSVESLPEALPRTKRARLVESQGREAKVELVQGKGMVEATYTVHLVRVSGRNELRFWLDRNRPHDIDDVWGYFRVERFDDNRSLVTVAVALDVGPGLVRMLFEDRIQALVLSTPRHIKDYVEPRAVATR